MAEKQKRQRKQKRYNPHKDAHTLNRVQVVGTLITTFLLGNYYWQATKQANPQFANEVDYKKKKLKKKVKATVDHVLRRDVVTEDIED